ncbi:MAG: TerB family tellurite resistance protein [Nannocystales bacterium]
MWTSAAPRAYHRLEAAMKEHIATITDLLLGAAYADKRLEGDELRAITNMVCKLLGVDELPEAQQDQLKAFNPAKFEVSAASSSLASLGEDDKKRVLELVASINESDDVIDFDEDAYLRKVATGLGVDDSVIAEHTIEILSDEDLDGMLADD